MPKVGDPEVGKLKVAAVVVAAGSGSRFGGEKQLLELGGTPLYRRVIGTFQRVDAINEIILVCSESLLEVVRDPGVHTVLGGASRQESVHNGVRKAGELGCDFVLVHDVARALITQELIEHVLEQTIANGSALLALPVVDTIKEVSEHKVVTTVSREKLWRAQTPQGGKVEDLLRGYAQAGDRQFTDESELLENIGIHPTIVPGSEENFKITYPEDFERAEHILALRAAHER